MYVMGCVTNYFIDCMCANFHVHSQSFRLVREKEKEKQVSFFMLHFNSE